MIYDAGEKGNIPQTGLEGENARILLYGFFPTEKEGKRSLLLCHIYRHNKGE